MKCPKCLKSMTRKCHKVITEKLLRKPYYFSQWDYCGGCGYVQHYEKYKVRNNNRPTIPTIDTSSTESYNGCMNKVSPTLSGDVYPDVVSCQHQWFEIKQLYKNSSISNLITEQKQGVLVKCANCEQEKELWENM